MVAQLLPPGQITFLDDDGNPLSNGEVYFYIPATTTFKNTWQDRGQTSLNTNPVQLDAAGRATIWGDGVYRQRVFDELGNEIWDKIVSTVDTSNNTGASGYYGGFTAVGGETSFSLVNQDGDSFTVAAGAEVTLGIYINGVKLELENYSTDGSDLVTLINSTTLVAGDLVYYEQTGGINLNVPGPGSITSAEQFGTTVTFTGRTLSGGTLMGQTITNAVFAAGITVASGNAIVGNASALTDGFGNTGQLQLVGTTNLGPSTFDIFGFRAAAAAPVIAAHHSRSNTVNSHTVLQVGDQTFNITAYGSSGSAWLPSGQVVFGVDSGTPGAASMPGFIRFSTTADGATSVTQHLQIDNKGNIFPGTAALATSATDGFVYAQSCAGSPSGTPTAYTGRVPHIVDTTNGRAYWYYGGAWHYAALT